MKKHPKLLNILICGCAIYYLAAYVVVAASRMAYPFELEWLEGSMLQHVQRILQGKPIYVKPGIEFISADYNPLYYYICAPLVRLMGFSFTPMRFVSFVCSLGTILAVGYLAALETGRRMTGLVAAGFFAASYALSGSWFDLARIDSLYLVLLMSATCIVRRTGNAPWMIFAGVLYALAFFTKQSALLSMMPLLIYALLVHRRRGLILLATLLVLLAAGVYILNHASDGWYLFYIFEMPRHFPKVDMNYLGFWRTDILMQMTIATLFGLYFILELWSRREFNRFQFHLLLGAGLVGGTWFIRLHSGADINNAMQAHAFLGIVFACGLHFILDELDQMKRQNRKWLPYFIRILALIQFAALLYSIRARVPDRTDEAAGWWLVEQINEVKGDVFIPSHPYLLGIAGKPMHCHLMSLTDIARCEIEAPWQDLGREIRGVLRGEKYDALILDSWFGLNDFHNSIKDNFQWDEYLFNPHAILNRMIAEHDAKKRFVGVFRDTWDTRVTAGEVPQLKAAAGGQADQDELDEEPKTDKELIKKIMKMPYMESLFMPVTGMRTRPSEKWVRKQPPAEPELRILELSAGDT